MDAESLVRPVVEGAGVELVDVAFEGTGGRRTLRVTVDRADGIDLDAIAALSDKIARRLDLEDFGQGRYDLEVSTPGIERSLRTPAQFARAVGQQVKVRTTTPVDDATVHVGRLDSVDDGGLALEIEGATRRVPIADIASARTVADWSAELKGTKV